MKTTWEYQTLTIQSGGWLSPKFDVARLEAQLNELGREGWELVGTVPTHDQGGKTHALVALLKRPR